MSARVTLIAAVASNRVIGRDNALPWRIPGDLPRFKAATLGQTLIMGRKTFESIGKALPGRETLVVTRRLTFAPQGVEVANTLEDAFDRVRTAEVFVAGGAEIYAQSMARAQCLMLTEIDAEFAGDALFPTFERSAWRVSKEERQEPSAEFPHAVWYRSYEPSS